MPNAAPLPTDLLPTHRDLFYGGRWHPATSGRYLDLIDPATGEALGQVAEAGAADVDAAVTAATVAAPAWRALPPLRRALLLRELAQRIRANADLLATLDALNNGNPISEARGDTAHAAGLLDFFAGLVTETKGSSFPGGADVVNFTVREPYGVIAKIVAYNHPLLFAIGKAAAALATGNAVVVKPPEQAPLSVLRLAEIIGDVLPPGVLNFVPGGREAGAALAGHPQVGKVFLVGSVPAGRAVLAAAAATIKPAGLELGGKNALIAFPDSDPDKVAQAITDGMNLTWCGQSCGSTSRAFVHEALYDTVVERVKARFEAIVPGPPLDPATRMGALISQAQLDKVLAYIRIGQEEGARLVCGGRRPDDPALAGGFFVLPTLFADVTMKMRIAREEIFGPVLSMLRWTDEATMINEVNVVEYGLTSAVWTNDLSTAHRVAGQVQSGYVWINHVAQHIPGAPFGGYKQSGMERDGGIGELMSTTQEKFIHIRLA